MLEVAGSLWSVAQEEQLETAERLRAHGVARLHWDHSDGRFATAGGFDARRARDLTARTGMLAEAHLMTVEPVEAVDAWTDFCDVVYVHIEAPDWQTALDRLDRRGTRGGLAVSLGTPLSAVPADVPVLCMSITPGRAGSQFDERVLARVAHLRSRAATRTVSVDGGVARARVEALVGAGAQRAVVGTDLVTDGGVHRWTDVLRALPGEHPLG